MKVLLLTFEENEEDILTRILSCIGNRTEILEYEDRGILQFEGLCIDKYKRNVVREENAKSRYMILYGKNHISAIITLS